MEYDIVKSCRLVRYYKKGENILHREGGPAYETDTGYKEWCINGDLHREYGPAIENKDGYKEWWVHGKRLSPEKEAILNKWWDNKNGI